LKRCHYGQLQFSMYSSQSWEEAENEIGIFQACCLEAFPLWLKFSFSNMHANLLANRLIMRIIAFAGVR